MAWLTLLTALLLTASCNKYQGQFKLEGEFRNMNQAEFYLYDAATGKKDTIHVQRGRFVYVASMPDTATLVMMFPNYSTIPVFAHSGAQLKMKGDASQLRETKVTGSKENEEMTAFRLKSYELTPPEIRTIAIDYIEDEPASPVSFYLLQRYFIESLNPDYREAMRLCNVMLNATPEKKPLIRLHNDLQILCRGRIGGSLPLFATLDTKGRIVTSRDLRAKLNIICLWSSWNYDSRSQVSTLRKVMRENEGKVAVMGISIDASRGESKDWVRRDSIDYPLICDGKMWQTPLALRMGLTDLPANIVADQKGKIIARDIPTKELKEKIAELLKEDR